MKQFKKNIVYKAEVKNIIGPNWRNQWQYNVI